VAQVPEVERTPQEALALAQQLLDDDLPFYAHDVLEAAWKAAPAAERDLWQGLAQVCVGLTHVQRGNPTGAARLLERGAGRLDDAAPAHGVDPAAMASWARRAARGRPSGRLVLR
jgi:predicted metal-dependent hydrolase